MYRILIPIYVSLCFLLACSSPPTAQQIINQAVVEHGGDAYSSMGFNFTFRGRNYLIKKNHGQFEYRRTWADSIGPLKEILNNSGYTRYRDNQPMALSSRDSSSYANSINSVAYFALLPYPLLEPAVKSEYLGSETVAKKTYHKLRVTFEQEGGGKDWEDVFIYWIDTDKFTVDYLAYEFHVDGGGTRFRKAFNSQIVGDIRIQDYHNYKGSVEDGVEDMARLFEAGKLTHLSNILLENAHESAGLD